MKTIIGIIETSNKLSIYDRRLVIKHFKSLGYKVKYYSRDMIKSGVEVDVDYLITADGGFDSSEMCKYVKFKRLPRLYFGFSDGTFLGVLLQYQGIPFIYGYNAIDFVNWDISRVFDIKKVEMVIKNAVKNVKGGIVGGNLTVFNLALLYLRNRYGLKSVLKFVKGKRIFFEDGGFNYVKGDGAFMLDIQLEFMRNILNVNRLSDIFIGVINGGIQDDEPQRNNYKLVRDVIKRHFGRIKVGRIRCSHNKNYMNNWIILK